MYKPSRVVVSGITAHSGGGAASAVAITAGSDTTITTSAAHGDSVILPVCPAGCVTNIKNSGSYDVGVYPPTGGNIDGLTVYYLASGSSQSFLSIDGSTFYRLILSERCVKNYISANSYVAANFSTANTNVKSFDITANIPPSSFGRHILWSARWLQTPARSLTIGDNPDQVGTANLYDRTFYESQQSGGAEEGTFVWIKTMTNGYITYRFSGSIASGTFNILGWTAEG